MTARPFHSNPGGAHEVSLLEMPAVAELSAPDSYMASNSRSFHFAAAFMRRPERERTARVYAWCRFVDDLADAAGDPAVAEARLDAWIERSHAAYNGQPSGITLIDQVMGEMAERGVPFTYASHLAQGVRSDLRFVAHRDLDELLVYAYRVAGVVGQWLSELHGVRDPWMLERAAALGQAMQLTNIVRDVGEDWDHGRMYIPSVLLERHGLSASDIGALRHGLRPLDDDYRNLLEELMSVASREYVAAREAIPHLPGGFRRAVAVAAAVYEGIHDAVRRNDYDNLRRRAVTTTARKVVRAAAALRSLGAGGAPRWSFRHAG
jgi:15-cis-phytoene synthase